MSKVHNIWNRIVLIFFCCYMLWVTLLSLRWAAEMDYVNYVEATTLVERSPIRSIVISILLVAAFCGIGVAMKKSKKPTMLRNTVIIATIAIHVILAILWLRANTYPLDADQRLVWGVAEALYKGQSLDELDYLVYNSYQSNVVEYLSYVPYQAGMLYAMKAVMTVTGISDPIVWRVLNVVALAFFELGLVMLGGEVFDSDKDLVMTMTALFELLFVPPVLYSTFVYGTILSMALAIWAFYGTVKLLKTGKAGFALFPIILVPLANRIYGGTLIATIAIVITLLVGCFTVEKRKRIYLLSTVVLMLACCMLSGKLARYALYKDTGIPENVGGIPVSDYVYMGIADDSGVVGPGSYSGIAFETYKAHGENTSAYALKQDIKVVKEYLSGDRDPGFFVEKTKYQWLDPYFEGLVMTCYPWSEYEVSEGFLTFLRGSVPKLMYKHWLRYFVPFIYLVSVITGVSLLIRKKTSVIWITLFLYFIGGFTFQIIWESKSRYCLPYFLCLLPIAAYGLAMMIKKLVKDNTIKGE